LAEAQVRTAEWWAVSTKSFLEMTVLRYVVHIQLAVLSSATVASSSAARTALIKGVSYGPVPLKSSSGAAQLPADDWFSDEAVYMWGKAGRGDLKVIKKLGANLVRLYGNSPASQHTNFLDEALLEGLSVAPGMSDFPFYQSQKDNCLRDTNFDCFRQVKPLYLENLRTGFLTMTQEYHPSLKYMNILNEPDLKMPPSATVGGRSEAIQMCRAIISAFDAMLDAEKEIGVSGPLINFTATFSYAICSSCQFFPGKPALGQMAQLDDAMRNPDKYDYSPKNDILAAYKARFTHSFNTQNPATDLQRQFLDDYVSYFPTTPVYIGEYHRVGANQTEDLEIVLNLAVDNPLFLGISFFQFQVAYWKTGSEMDFGMFGLGDHVLANMTYFSSTYSVYCLKPEASRESGMVLPNALALAYGGPGVDVNTLCIANPLGVPLDHAGYAEIASQQSAPQMELFVRRLIHHLGATVRVGDEGRLRAFADSYVGGGGDAFARMASELGSQPSWVDFDRDARCMANRDVEPGSIGQAIGWACSNSPSINCSDIPEFCSADPYRVGDYVFSRYYKRHGDTSNPLLGCSFQGAAIFASPKVFNAWTGASSCSEATTTTTVTMTTTTGTTTATTTTATVTSTTVTSTATSQQFMSMGKAQSMKALHGVQLGLSLLVGIALLL
jgi:hypothetical protein